MWFFIAIKSMVLKKTMDLGHNSRPLALFSIHVTLRNIACLIKGAHFKVSKSIIMKIFYISKPMVHEGI